MFKASGTQQSLEVLQLRPSTECFITSTTYVLSSQLPYKRGFYTKKVQNQLLRCTEIQAHIHSNRFLEKKKKQRVFASLYKRQTFDQLPCRKPYPTHCHVRCPNPSQPSLPFEGGLWPSPICSLWRAPRVGANTLRLCV